MIVVQDTVILSLSRLGVSFIDGVRFGGEDLARRINFDYVRTASLGGQAGQRGRVTDVDLPEAVHNEMQILQLDGFRDRDVQSALEYRRKPARFVVELAQEVSHQ